MKKYLALLLALVMVLALVACGTTPPPETDDTATDPGTETPAGGDEIKVDVFWYTFSDTYLASVRNAMEEQLATMSNIKATMHDCEEDQSKQTEKIQTAITQGTDLLIVNIVTTGSEEAAQSIVDLATEADLPLIFFNREVSNEIVQSYDKCVFVGTDADEAGVMQGQAVANMLMAEENMKDGKSIYDIDGNGEIKYIMFRGEHGNAEAFGRTYYAVYTANELLKDSGIKLVPSPANETSTQYDDDGISNYFLYGNWSAATAADLMRTALAANKLDDGSIELILANNDDQAIGAIEAMNEEGYNTGVEGAGFIPVFGVDATAVAKEALAAGKMSGTILQDGPAMADGILFFAQNIANGKGLADGMNEHFDTVDPGVNKVRIPYSIVA